MMRFSTLALIPLLVGACDSAPSAPQYYDRVIQPIFNASCIRGQGGCHTNDGTGNALGNLDLTSYENAMRRPDVFRTYGSFPEPLLLLKGAGPGASIPYKPGQGDGKTAFLDSQIVHAGGFPLSRNSEAFFTLQQWLANGATRDGSTAVKQLDATGHGACTADFTSARPDLAAKVPMVSDSDPIYVQFKNDVEPMLAQNCAFGSCHSSPQSDFFLTCDGGDGTKFNYLEARDFVASPPESSEFLLRPLAPSAGGVSHTGGVYFANKEDANYKKVLAWAAAAGPPDASQISTGEAFFDHYVMPVFIQRGCALEGCHSPGAANDFKLRPGSQGYFSPSALDRNYNEARQLFLDVDVPDVRQSRLVKKPVVRVSEGGFGIPHRGGPVLVSEGDPPGMDPSQCPTVDPNNPTQVLTLTAFCKLALWHQIERQALLTAGKVDSFAPGSTEPLVYVKRPPDLDRLIEFDRYRPGADLILADATVGTLGAITAVGNPRSLLTSCPGTLATRDVRHPDVDYDASRVVFAMRLSASDALDLYTVKLDGSACTDITKGDGSGNKQKNGIDIDNFDPIFAPTVPSSIVFASTRGGAAGPTLSLKFLLPQSDIWRLPGDAKAAGGLGAPQQMTALLDSELGPAMMMNGEVTFTAEKSTANFYQLSGRRINWDGTDYHPLLAQRAQSIGFDYTTFNTAIPFDQLPVHPSVGYQRATEIREGIDRNFVFIASDDSVPGAGGALATFNRSVGPFEADRSGADFLQSMEIIDGDGHQAGANYRSPFQLPDGQYMASYGSGGAYDLVAVDPRAPAGARRRMLLSCGGQACVQAVLGYKRERKPLFDNVRQLVFGGHVDSSDPSHGVVIYPDLPMLATILGANLRTGRFVEQLRAAKQVAIYQEMPPTDAASAKAKLTGPQMVYQDRRLMGVAPLADDGSVKLELPSLLPMIIELQDGSGKPIFTMSEEDQLGPGEFISRGVPEKFFNSTCGGCHGSVSGQELDVAIQADALTGASACVAESQNPVDLK